MFRNLLYTKNIPWLASAVTPNISRIVAVSRERDTMKVWEYFDIFHFVFNRYFGHD